MKSSLTNRDKRLLLFMFLFVVIVGIGYWGIYPQIKAFAKLGKEIEKEEVKQSINEQKVSNLIFVESQCEEYEESMAENKERFFDILNEADIDLLLTGKAIKHKLESFNLSINISEAPSQRRAYRYSDLYVQQQQWEEERAALYAQEESEEDLLDMSGKSDSKKKDKDDEEEKIDEYVDVFGNTDMVGANNDIYAAKVTMTLGGKKSDLENFLQEIMDSDKEILITSFAWSKYRTRQLKEGVYVSDSSDSDLEVVEMDALTVTMEIYMCEKD
ncbi:MAG: hypothetical protein K6G75_13305 [Lachnospiraceae bacterium]|nr:hypothetical protein [Lachnospiraceae bacterium]